jgi:hypothetical protein
MSASAVPSSSGAAATDPDFDAVESLYRGASGHSGLRAYEPSMRPPEGTLDYGWLFRPDEPAVHAPSAEPQPASSGPGPRTTTACTTTSGADAVPGADPVVRWLPGTQPAGRRWPAAALLAATLSCALLLPWVVNAL